MSKSAQQEDRSVSILMIIQLKYEYRRRGSRPFVGKTRTPLEDFRRWAATSRLVCRAFNAIFTPHAYRFIDLNTIPALNELLLQHPDETFVKHVHRYCQVLHLCHTAVMQLMTLSCRLIERCHRLQTLRLLFDNLSWNKFSDSREHYTLGHLATLILHAFLRSQYCQSSTHGFQFHVESYEISLEIYHRDCKGSKAKYPEWKYVAQYLRPVTRSPLLSPCVQSATPQTVIPVLRVSLIEECFQLQPRAIGGKMPPVQKLIFFNYDWKQRGQHLGQLWDLSQLRSFSLEYFECIESLEDLPTTQLANLQVLKLQIDIESKEEINQLIIGNLIGRLESLELLKLGLPVASAIDASALFKHGGVQLRRLDLLSSFPSAFEMKKICQYCPQLADVDFWLCHEEPSVGKGYDCLLDVLADAQCLQAVTIWASRKNFIRVSLDTETESTDPTYDAIQHFMASLHRKRLGKRFDMVNVCVPGYGPFKIFQSRINQQGVYEKFGPESCERQVIKHKEAMKGEESGNAGSSGNTSDDA